MNETNIGVRVGATPEPRWVQVMRAEVAETKHFKVGSVTHLYEMAVAFYDEFARAALRAPEPLTARRIEVLQAERDNARARLDRAVQILAGIHALINPPYFTDPDGKVWQFKSPLAHDQLQRLSDAIRAIPDEVAALEGGASRTEPALTALLAEARGWFVADPENPIGVVLKDARGERIRDWLIEVDHALAIPPAPPFDRGWSLREALAELIAVKDLRNKINFGCASESERAGYEMRRDQAYQAASAVLSREPV